MLIGKLRMDLSCTIAFIRDECRSLNRPEGWPKVLDTCKTEYLPMLQQNHNTYVIMIINCDGTPVDVERNFAGLTRPARRAGPAPPR